MNLTNHSNQDLSEIETLVSRFYPYAKEAMGFDRDVNISFQSDEQNAANPLGNTAYYAPEKQHIVIFVDNRHPKDILRSLSHELVHHTQNCRGDFDNQIQMEDGYAQKDPHLREMEREAYETGNMIFRDWTDTLGDWTDTLGDWTDTVGDWTDTLDECLKRKFNLPMLKEEQVRNLIKKVIKEYCCNHTDEDKPGKHSREHPEKKQGALFAQFGVTLQEDSVETIIEPGEAIRMNRIKPFVEINKRTYKWEEFDGVHLKVIDEQGEEQQFRLSDIDDIKTLDIQEPIEEWYRDSLYKKLLTEYSR